MEENTLETTDQPEDFIPETTSQKDDAVNNLSIAAKLDVEPDVYSKNKQMFQPRVKALNEPVLDSMSQDVATYSEQHKALIYGDPDNFNKLSKSVKRMGDAWTERVPREKERTDIVWEWLKNPKNITPEQRMRVLELQSELKDIQGDAGFVESLPSEIVAQLGQMKEMGKASAVAVGTATAAAAGAGAMAGSVAGPIGATIGAISSGGTALKWSLGAAMVYQGFKATSAQTYVQLNDIEDEKGNTLDYETKRDIALGVGALSAGVDFVANKYLMQTVPFLNKLSNKQALHSLVFNPKNQAWRTVLANIGKSVGANSASGAFQSIISTLANDLGKAGADGDYSEMSVLNTLSNSETWKEAGKGAVIGGTTAAVIGSVFAKTNVNAEEARLNRVVENARPVGDSTKLLDAPTDFDFDGNPPLNPEGPVDIEVNNYVKEKRLPQKIQTAAKDVSFGDNIRDVVDTIKSNPQLRKDRTVMQKISEQFIEKTGIGKVYIDPAQVLNMLPNLKDDAIKQKYTDILNRNRSELPSAPVIMPIVDLVNVAIEDPKILGAVLRTPESEPYNVAKNFADKIQDSMESVSKELSEITDPKEAREILDKALSVKDQPSDVYEFATSLDYMTTENFPEEIKTQLSEKQRADFDSRIFSVRKEQVNAELDAQNQMASELINLTTRKRIRDQMILAEKEARTNPNIKIVEKYLGYKKQKADFIYQVDPAKLTEAQRQAYADSATLKKIGFFKKGGVDPEQALAEIGPQFSSVDEMLQTLDKTPTLDEALKSSREYLAMSEREGATTDIEKLSEGQWQKYYSDKTQVHLDFADTMKNSKWSMMKKMVIGAAFKTPSLQKVKSDVALAAMTYSIEQLNPKIFKRAEANAQKAAVKALLEGDVLKHHEFRVQAAYAAAMTSQAHNAIRKANAAARKLDWLSSEQAVKILKTAGEDYYEAGQELVAAYTPDVNIKRATEKKRYNVWAKSMLNKNIGDFEIPEHLVSPAQELSDLSYSDLTVLNEGLDTLIHQAKMKNKLLRKQWAKEEITTVTDIVNQAVVSMKSKGRPDRSPKMDNMNGGALQWYLSGLRRVTSLAREMDGGVNNGPMQKVLRAIYDAENVKIVSQGNFNEAMFKHIEQFDKDGESYNKMAERRIYVKEFAEYPKLRNGDLTEAQLYTILLNLGNEGNIKRAENFGVRGDLLMDVTKKYLKPKHFDLAQKKWSTLAAYKPEIERVNRNVYGYSDVQWVEGKPFEAFGKEYSGGYYPIVSDWENTFLQADLFTDAVKTQKPVEEVAQRYFGLQEFTNTSHLKQRTGSQNILDLSPDHFFRSYDSLIHDITMREALTDASKVLSNAELKTEMLKFFGNKEDVEAFSKWLVEISNIDRNPQNYAAAGPVVKFLQIAQKNFAVGQLVFNIGTPITQLFSLGLVPIEFKNITDGYSEIAKTFTSTFANPELFQERIDFWSQRDPKIREAVSEYYDLQSAKNILEQPKGKSPFFNSVKRGMIAMQESGFIFIKKADLISQVVARESAYQLARDGQVKGVNPDDEVQIIQFANEMSARRVTANSITQVSEFQRNRLVKAVMMSFQSGINLIYNTIVENKHDIQDGFRQAKQEYKSKGTDGDFTNLKRSLQDFAVIAFGASILPAIVSTIRQAKKTSDVLDEEKIAKEAVLNALGPFPVLQGLMFTAFNKWSDSPVPLMQQALYLKDAMQFSLYEAQRLAQFKKPKIDMSREGKQDYKGFVMTTTQSVGLPSRALWNVFLSPQAMSDNKKLINKSFRSIRKEYEAFIDSEDFQNLDEDHKVELSETVKQLKKLEEGDMSPIQDLNNDSTNSVIKLETVDPQINKEEDVDIEKDDTMRKLYEPAPSATEPSSKLLDGKPYENLVARIPDDEKIADSQVGLKDYLTAIKGIESFGGRTNVKASTSSATGIFQFTDATWAQVVALDKKSDNPILKDDGRIDPVQQIRAIQILTNANADGLTRVGIEVSPVSLYMSHLLGISSAVALLKANKDADPAGLLKPRVISNNAAILDKVSIKAVVAAVKNKLDNGRKISDKIEKQLALVKPDLTTETAWHKVE